MKKLTATIGLLALLLVASLGLTSPASAQKKMIQIKGSDTMVNLVQILAEEYMAKKPGTAIAVLGGGSGTGITAIINGTCDLANHSREWKPKELDLAYEKGVRPRIFAIAVDALSIIVNEKNPIETLTMAQVGSIFRGEIKNWKVLGGPDQKISLYGRQSNSGTYSFLQEHVLNNKNYSPDVKEMNGNAQIIEAVVQDLAGIGYVGVGYLYDEKGEVRKGLKVLKIKKDDNAPEYSPLDKEAVYSAKYAISRPLYQCTNGKPSAAVADFIRFELSPEGQAIVEKEGFFKIGKDLMDQNEKNLR
ncbi:MAG: Phosphate ABC transporter, periplasmic phosphate-binding protein PstS [Candidatus Saccharicenans subterraneus]|uniref:Phosphate-binding protein n=1 Tax=Candidatus Saccharicenans subterraneus TaxID=2508984 RepID=A0A3E2BQB2_9BACT|nr:MAG: Phosphate ABC transporter, periplasmic phosphate-binding protein PstS [Candidatus Saccharicenans subterraneum]